MAVHWPLGRLRVLDLGTFVAAPFAATLLAEFGAQVVKVEQPGSGDSLRTLGPSSTGCGRSAQTSRGSRTWT